MSSASSSRPPLNTTRHRRPLSAIFLGNPAQLPDLPEPPSTDSSPGSSGLPSPPASNSTGSGSNGGDLSNESLRMPASLMKDTINGAGGRRAKARSRSASRSPSDDGDGADDEDHTARLSGGPPHSNSGNNLNSNESALQRVKSLTQRNRLVLSKLASLSSGSRLATSSPTTSLRRSPAPSTANSIASTSRLTRRRSESISRASGSETERENVDNGASDSEGLSETPTSTTGTHFRSFSMAERRLPAVTESKAELPVRGRSVDLRDESIRQSRPQSRAESIEAAALAAVAQSRRDTPVEMRRRQPLPREFLGNDSIGHPPQTPKRERTVSGSYSVQESPSSSRATLHDSPMSPRTRAQRFSSIRDITRRNQTRRQSQDLSPLKNVTGPQGDSPIRRVDVGDSPRRNFVGESLRAAGLVRLREESDDVFGGAEASRRLRISSDVGARPSENRLETSARPGTRFSERPVASDTERYVEPRTPANAPYAVARRNAQTTIKTERPLTSMDKYRDEPQTAPPALRSYKSTYAVPEPERDRPPTGDLTSRPSSELRRFAISTTAAAERTGSSLGVRRSPASPLHAASAAAGDGTPEHTRLMLDSLGMFESQLSRLPSLGSTTTVTIPELFRSAQNIVHSADALSNMLRRGTAHALEEQIDAELGEDGRAIDLVSLWRDVGAEYRESVRVSDELVRTMTSFLLGVGKVLREASSESSHNRTLSIDDSPRRRYNTPDVPANGDGSRRSESTRLSSEGNRSSLDGKSRWIVSSGDTGRTQTSFTSLHSASSTTSFRHPATSVSMSSISRQQLADAELGSRGTESINENDIASRKLARLSLTTATARHLDRDRELKVNNTSFDESPIDSPSVSAAARRDGILARRSNTVAAPPPLSTLPSETILSRRSTEKAASVRSRPKTSGSTARAATSIFSTLTSAPEPTTAVNTTQASPERPRRVATTSRTFSRAGGAAAARLEQSIERDVQRKRTLSVSSVVEPETQGQTRNASDAEAVRDRPSRASLDSATSASTATTATATSGAAATAGTFSARAARDRRVNVTNLFTRS
ncbi:hypothetical protein ACEPAG_2968 [Sanghuangporus baumii]